MKRALLSARWSRSVKAIVKSAICDRHCGFLVSDLALPRLLLLPFGHSKPILRHPGSDWADCLCQLSPSRQARGSGSASMVLPDTVFEAIVKIPYDTNVQQVIADGSKAVRRRCTDAAGRLQNCS